MKPSEYIRKSHAIHKKLSRAWRKYEPVQNECEKAQRELLMQFIAEHAKFKVGDRIIAKDKDGCAWTLIVEYVDGCVALYDHKDGKYKCAVMYYGQLLDKRGHRLRARASASTLDYTFKKA